MAESSAKIVFRGDAKHAIGEAKKVQDETKKIGKEGAGASAQFRQMGTELAKAVGRALALKVALGAAVQGVKEYQTAAASASRKTGASIVERDLAAGKLGLTSGDAEGIVGGTGARSRDELTSFITNLGSGDNAKRMDRQSTFRAAELYGSGLFSESEVIDAAKNGRLDQLRSEYGKREAALSSEGRRELSIRSAENGLASRQFAADSQRGTEQRLAEARYAAQAAESPMAAAVVNNLPGGVGATVAQALQTALDNQTDRLLVESRQPTLAPGADQ